MKLEAALNRLQDILSAIRRNPDRDNELREKAFDDAVKLLLSRCSGRITLIDVGARWGLNEPWTRIGEAADIVCFEPDAEECARLNAQRPSNVRYLPFGLSNVEAERELYVTTAPGCSSLHRPISALYEHYPPLKVIKPERTVRIPCRRLDDVLSDKQIHAVGAIKLDTQGSELEILQGASQALESCSLVDIEVEFNPIYEGQALFSDVDSFLRHRGFVLWRLENLVHYAPEVVPAGRTRFVIAAEPSVAAAVPAPNGQLFWAQAQYVRAAYPRSGADHLPAEAAAVAALIAGVYGFWDLSLELIRKTGDAELLRTLHDTLQGIESLTSATRVRPREIP